MPCVTCGLWYLRYPHCGAGRRDARPIDRPPKISLFGGVAEDAVALMPNADTVLRGAAYLA